ncbi:hypothetical protein CTAM01_00966 [Colletotrichum tamarilloi]|uniref:Uncharacterized protein n=1 Tax=Colletotrichum tamarilloi TaxID=1209934 RepID=A0ABQ9RSR1_9PEZI|nr:uncharacterized protein CTAM01_00966 [Colletotrichum tamarilloi]KAK1512036.1 hypothetical protein CTAM01_00966 [Colletotrichum tamarilloi]
MPFSESFLHKRDGEGCKPGSRTQHLTSPLTAIEDFVLKDSRAFSFEKHLPDGRNPQRRGAAVPTYYGIRNFLNGKWPRQPRRVPMPVRKRSPVAGPKWVSRIRPPSSPPPLFSHTQLQQRKENFRSHSASKASYVSITQKQT